MSDGSMIEATGLSKRYGDTQALDDVDLQAAGGSILGVLGPNGAGKSTTVRMLTTHEPARRRHGAGWRATTSSPRRAPCGGSSA